MLWGALIPNLSHQLHPLSRCRQIHIISQDPHLNPFINLTVHHPLLSNHHRLNQICISSIPFARNVRYDDTTCVTFIVILPREGNHLIMVEPIMPPTQGAHVNPTKTPNSIPLSSFQFLLWRRFACMHGYWLTHKWAWIHSLVRQHRSSSNGDKLFHSHTHFHLDPSHQSGLPPHIFKKLLIQLSCSQFTISSLFWHATMAFNMFLALEWGQLMSFPMASLLKLTRSITSQTLPRT